jgi:fatty-acyl-CoA synthase
MNMLKQSNRDQFHTLLDAVTLTASDDTQPAIIYVETEKDPVFVSRADFRQVIYKYAAALQLMGVQPRDLVIIAHTQNLESIYAFWGALAMGAIPSMFPTLTEKLDPDIYMRNMAELVSLSNVRAVLTTDEFAPELAAHVGCPIYGSNQLMESVANAGDIFETYTPPPDEIAFLQHSSGTTGLQKGVALAHTAVLNQVASYSDSLNLTEQDVVVSWLPLYHDMGLIAGFLMPLIQGIPLVLMSPFDWVRRPALLFRTIQDYKGTLCWLPNFAYNHCARRIRQRDIEGLSVSSIRAFINCSEPVRDDSHQLFLERFAEIGVTPEMMGVSYAMAENVFAVTQTPAGTPTRRLTVDQEALGRDRLVKPVAPDSEKSMVKVSCGPAIDGVAIRIVDKESGAVLPDGTVGELSIKSACMLTGYYKREDLDPFTEDGWYLTGDMGFVYEDEIYVIGRYKDLIINGGKNVYPQDLENIVNTVEGVHPGRAVAFGVPDEREGTELIAIIAEVDTEDSEDHKRISQSIRQTIAQQSMVTVNYVKLVGPKWLIKTSSGKIARAANREKWLAEQNNHH